jgi:hypothetical protein
MSNNLPVISKDMNYFTTPLSSYEYSIQITKGKIRTAINSMKILTSGEKLFMLAVNSFHLINDQINFIKFATPVSLIGRIDVDLKNEVADFQIILSQILTESYHYGSVILTTTLMDGCIRMSEADKSNQPIENRFKLILFVSQTVKKEINRVFYALPLNIVDCFKTDLKNEFLRFEDLSNYFTEFYQSRLYELKINAIELNFEI